MCEYGGRGWKFLFRLAKIPTKKEIHICQKGATACWLTLLNGGRCSSLTKDGRDSSSGMLLALNLEVAKPAPRGRLLSGSQMKIPNAKV